jgi:predicted anti-sigma-YlaC factor YlaD
MSLLTCEQFLEELNDYLDETAAAELRPQLEAHLKACPNCWVICDTTKKTIQIYKGVDPYAMPEEVGARLRAALRTKMGA